MSILNHIRLHKENKFNNEPYEEIYEYIPCREQVESYSEDKYDDESLCLDEVFQVNLDTHTPPKEIVELYGENVCENDEPLFLYILFKDECDHSSENTHIEDFKFRVPFEKKET